MATDIAFSLAILRLLGKRVPLGLKVFLTAFAIVDDLGAVMVIALFYSESINWALIGIALLMLAFLFFLSHKRIYARGLILVFGIVIWVLFLKAGIHPTIAGVLLAFTIPIAIHRGNHFRPTEVEYGRNIHLFSEVLRDAIALISLVALATQFERALWHQIIGVGLLVWQPDIRMNFDLSLAAINCAVDRGIVARYNIGFSAHLIGDDSGE